MGHFNEHRSNFQTFDARWLAAAVLLLTTACETRAPVKEPPSPPGSAAPAAPAPVPHPIAPPSTQSVPTASGAALRPAAWNDLPAWRDDDHAAAWEALRTSCSVLAHRDAWRSVCSLALQSERPDRAKARRFFETHFAPYQLVNADGRAEGLITGYYEPLLRGSRQRSARYGHPVYGVPDDLLVVDLGELYTELKGKQLRGRLDGRRIVPYYDRAGIEGGLAPVRGREIAWVEDPVELFFLQIQGSGRIELENGSTLRVGFADQNGHPYRSIGRWLVERGELPLEKASMQGIKAWARENPGRLPELLNHNARYVFFRELPADLSGPIGALGVPLTAQRSVAVDPTFVPLGAPVYVATTWPNSTRPLNRLVLAQDAGAAIRGAVRADFFWGFGADAAREAGRMKQPLRMWVMLPLGYPISGK